MLRKHWMVAMGLGIAVLGQMLVINPALARYDIIHLANGQVVKGKIISSPGEIIRIRTGIGAEDSITRMQINGRNDIVITTDRKLYRGEINYIDPFKLEIITSHGRFQMWRMLVNKIILGVPQQQVDLNTKAVSNTPTPGDSTKPATYNRMAP